MARWLRDGSRLVLLLVGLLLPALRADANCTCTPPGGDALCPSNCAACTFTSDCCQCNTTCTLSTPPACLSGYTALDTFVCTPLPLTLRRQCQLCALHQTSTCASCVPGTFGSSCVACPGGAANPCNGHGTCDDGFLGNGTCSCTPADVWRGNACQFSDATTCNGHGTVNAIGQCTCAAGYAGATCNQCAPLNTGYPYCGTICGDVNDDANVDAADVTAFRLYLADPTGHAFTPAGADRCTVAPLAPTLPPCDVLDLVVIRRSLQTPPLAPGRAPDCPAVQP